MAELKAIAKEAIDEARMLAHDSNVEERTGRFLYISSLERRLYEI